MLAQTLPPAQSREAFVGGVTQQVLGILHNNGTSLAMKKTQLEHTFGQVTDVAWIAQSVMGSAWESANAQQREEYVGLYSQYLSGTYLAGLDEQTQHKVRDIRVTGMEDMFEDAFMVHTQLVMTEGQPISVDYLVREDGGARKVVDIVLEGVSTLKSHRAELGALAKARGVDGVIRALHDKMRGTQLALRQ
ncbi:MAG: ABC transporter substrate-binding protein [Rickettsiales bacterium]|nr:ABC transporter substrate-binding protein [Rickettsiales bacterium]